MTSIRDYGGEFALIGAISGILGKPKDRKVIAGIGDDAAVIALDKKRDMLVTVDMLVEGDHFRREWSTPRQIGRKAMEVNVSDIAAMGGLPKYALVSISLPDDTTAEFVMELYRGMKDAARKHRFDVIGGNTTHGSRLVIDVIIIGEVEKNRLRLRSDAKAGDLICVTGTLGKSTAGLETLKAGVKGNVREHLEPRCRLHEAREISKYANAMIDVSDGLSSEVGHICEMSDVGAEVFREKIPISMNTRSLAKNLGKDPVEFALHGGEDFELVFTIPERRLKRIRTRCQITVVGRITKKRHGITLAWGKVKLPLGGGYDHFRLRRTS
ncbi:MAG: thiamine-phosphate kinase [Candidatus Altiarchaeota archaeon]|nr:thiamine-phosphate kinase [Candidatus Altiarchaeota archaeon]